MVKRATSGMPVFPVFAVTAAQTASIEAVGHIGEVYRHLNWNRNALETGRIKADSKWAPIVVAHFDRIKALHEANRGSKVKAAAKTITRKTPKATPTIIPGAIGSQAGPWFTLPTGFAADYRRSGIVEAFEKAGRPRTARIYEALMA